MGEGCVTGANGVSRESHYPVKSIFTFSLRRTPAIALVYALFSPVLPNGCPAFPQPLALSLHHNNYILCFCLFRRRFPNGHIRHMSIHLPNVFLRSSSTSPVRLRARHRAPVLRSVPPLVFNGGFQRSASPGSAQRRPPHVRTICQHMLFFALHIPRT